jgi:hypothetical protein
MINLNLPILVSEDAAWFVGSPPFIGSVVQKIQQSYLGFCNLALSYFDESASLNI